MPAVTPNARTRAERSAQCHAGCGGGRSPWTRRGWRTRAPAGVDRPSRRWVRRPYRWGRLRRMDEDTVHFARRLATTLMVVARITTPNKYDSTAWRRAALRIGLELMSVSETWKVMPSVSAM